MNEFTEFYAASKDRVFRTMIAAIGNRSDAEDAVAEAYARAFVRWRRLSEHPNPIGWVLITALNTHRRWWRGRREYPGEIPERVDLPPDGAQLPAELRRLVLALPRRQREVVALRLVADMSAEQTGALLGITAATVNVHLHRAVTTLRTRLGMPTKGELTR